MFDSTEITVSNTHDRLPTTRGQGSQPEESPVLEYLVRLNQNRVPADVLRDLRQSLDSRGFKGRYLIEEGWRTSGALVSIFVNSSRVVEMLENQDELVQKALDIQPSPFTVCRHVEKVKHVVSNQNWETVHALMNIRLRFDSPELKQVLDKINDLPGSGRDQRMAVVEQANAARKEAIKSIQRALAQEGLERKFTVPRSQWDGTNNSLTIVGTATVRACLVLQANVTVERPLRTARGW